MSIDHFEARYEPGLGARYAVQSWIVSAVLAVVAVAVSWGVFEGNPQWWVIPVLVVVFGPVLAVTVASAVEAPGKWGADDRLALRLDADGLTLPRIGCLAWSEITAIRIVDTGGINASTWLRAWEAQAGSSSHRFVTVWVRDADAVVTRTGGTAAAFRNLYRYVGRGGFDGVWGVGLRSPSWDMTVAAIQRAATAHNIPLLGKAAISMDRETTNPAAQELEHLRLILMGMMKPGDTELRHVVEWRLGELHQGTTRAYHPQGEFESADGRFNRAIPPRELYGAIGSLRAAMYRPGVGTWFSAEFRVTAEGALTTSFVADTEPAWGSGVTPAAIIADLAEFPRDGEHMPSWLRDRLAGIPASKPHDPADDDPRPVLPTGQWRELARAVTARFVDGLDLEGAAVPPGAAPFVRLPTGFSLSRSSTDGSFAAGLVTVLAVYGETVRAGRAVAELRAFPFETHRVPDPSTWAMAVQVVAFFARRHGDTGTVASLHPLLEILGRRGVTAFYLSGRLLRDPLDETPRAGVAIPDDRGRASSYLLQLRGLASMAEYGASSAYPRERIDAEVDRYLAALFALPGFEPANRRTVRRGE